MLQTTGGTCEICRRCIADSSLKSRCLEFRLLNSDIEKLAKMPRKTLIRALTFHAIYP